MRWLFVVLTLLALALGSFLTPPVVGDGILVQSTPPRTPEEERKGFHLPPGFDIELVAAEPDIHKPINMNFDEHGRLWVTESVEYPFPAGGDKKGRDAVKIIEWSKPQGKAERVTQFADGLNIPIGVLPLNGTTALVHSIPNIYRLSDTQKTGHADQREVMYGTYGYRDTHGMTGSFTLGFDGWVYACHGFANSSTIKAKDGSSITMQSGNTYRMKTDGSHVEQWTWGQVNPFGLCFDPLGNLFSADCHSRPAMELLRGGYYSSFGKPHDGLGFAPEIMTHGHGATAICGIVYYAADQFPKEWQDTLFLGNVVTNRINHDKLERHGSSVKAIETPDFLSSDDGWFRPVDIKLGPDGCLYVADFYNRIIGHYEVPLDHPGRDRERGRIWRIFYKGQDGKNEPKAPRNDWAKATVNELVTDLAHPNLTVRMLATHQLAARGGDEVKAAVKNVMKPETNAFQRMQGLWVLERLGALDDPHLNAAADDKEAGVRVHAMRLLAERTNWNAEQRQHVVSRLSDTDPTVQRTAADALARHPAADNLRPLLDLRHKVAADDTHLLHTVRMALRDQLRIADNWQRVSASWSDADLRAIADVAPGVHSPESALFLLRHIQRSPEGGERLNDYVHHVARFAAEGQTPELLAFVRKDRPEDLHHQAALFKAVQQGTQERGAPLSADARRWAEELVGKLLASRDNNLLQTGVEMAGAMKMEGSQDALVKLLHQKDLAEQPRRSAITSLVAIDAKRHVLVLGHMLGDAAEPAGLREHVASVLAGLNQPETRAELLKVLPTAPARLQSAIAAALARTPQGADELLNTLKAGKASARLLLEKPVELGLAQSKLPDLKERVGKLTQGLPAVDERIQKLLQQRREGFVKTKGDAMAGLKVFEKSCAICHQISNKGAKIGPQLDGIGVRGLERLLEDVLDPNRNVDQAFRSTTLGLKNGQFVTGLVLREEGEIVVLADNQGKEVRVPKDTIEERTTSQLSPMPANFGEQVAEKDFYDLMAYLLEQRPPAK
jgi:putative heme-binding domain-containing protein